MRLARWGVAFREHGPGPTGSEFDGLDAHALAHLGGGGHGPTLRDQQAALGRPAVWAALVTTLLGYGGAFTSNVHIAPQLTDVAGFDPLLAMGPALGSQPATVIMMFLFGMAAFAVVAPLQPR